MGGDPTRAPRRVPLKEDVRESIEPDGSLDTIRVRRGGSDVKGHSAMSGDESGCEGNGGGGKGRRDISTAAAVGQRGVGGRARFLSRSGR